MNKSVGVKAGWILGIIIAVFGLTTCETLKTIFREPLLTLHSAQINEITFTGIQVLCRINVDNPNPISIPFPDIDWEFYINANSFVKGRITANQSIGARRTTIVDVPVSFSYLEVYNTFASLKNNKQADYKVALAATFSLPVLGDKTWRFEHEGVFPVLQLPTLSFNGIRVKNFSLTKVDLELAWEVENPNNFAMNLKDLSYNLTVNNSRWVTGKVPGSPQISADRKTSIPLEISISNLTIVRDIIDIITKGTNVTFACTGNFSLGSSLPGLKDFSAPFNFDGNTRLSR
jgi:LEA14-like dessication related protein